MSLLMRIMRVPPHARVRRFLGLSSRSPRAPGSPGNFEPIRQRPGTRHAPENRPGCIRKLHENSALQGSVREEKDNMNKKTLQDTKNFVFTDWKFLRKINQNKKDGY